MLLKSLLLLPLIKLRVYVVLLRRRSEKRVKDRFQFPSSVKIKIPDGEDRACHSYANEMCFYEADFISGLRFPIHPFIRKLFFLLQLASAQLVPN